MIVNEKANSRGSSKSRVTDNTNEIELCNNLLSTVLFCFVYYVAFVLLLLFRLQISWIFVVST